MKTPHGKRLSRGLAVLAGAALTVGLSLAAAPAANASSPFDWQVSVSPHTVQLDDTVDVTWSLICQNTAGCDVDSDLNIQAWAENGATITTPGTSIIRTGGSDYVGLCHQDGSTHIDCDITDGPVHIGYRQFLHLGTGGGVGDTGPWSLQTPVSATSSPMLDFGLAPSPGTRRVDSIRANLDSGSASADLELTKTGPGTVEPGGTVTYDITVANNGPDASSGYTVTDELPAGLLNPSTSTPGCTITSGTLTCTSSNTLAAGIHDVYQVTGTAPQSGQLSNTASVTGVTADPESGNNSDTVVTTIEQAPVDNPSGDWGTSGSDLMPPGTNRSYTLTFTCLSAGGCDYAPGMTITDHAGTGAGFIPGSNTVSINGQTPVGTCQVTGSDVDCQINQTGHANQGDTIGTQSVTYRTFGNAPADTQVFDQTLTVPAGWTGDDPSNNTFPISTPPVAGTPMITWQAGTGIGAVIVLLGGGALLLRRRTRAGIATS